MSSRRAILRRFTIPLVLALVVVTTMAAPAHAARPRASLTTVTAVMDWPTPWMGWTPWLVADAKGYFAAEGIKFNLVIPATVADPAKVLGTGHADFAFTTILDVIEGRAQGAPIIGVGAYAQYNNWGIIKWKDSKLTPKDLAGKSIGVYPDAWSKTQLTIFLKHVGIGINQVKLVYTSSDTVPLLLTHKVDVITGVTNAEQTEAEVTGKRATTMYLANKYGVPNAYIWVLAANTNFLHSHPAVARGWLRAARRGLTYALAHPRDVVSIFMKRYPTALDRTYAIKSWANTVPLYTSDQTRAHGFFWQIPQVWQQTQQTLKTYGIIDQTMPVDQLYTNAYLH
ncbi:MAG TPA: ABC transporter substrate-binding protein [Chloroflexota bacterium]|nr:ABC transporter substrate-binding protein [Chloroflexota bacterium]